MLGNYGAKGAASGAGEEARDARWMALTLMSKALGHLDGDSSIPANIGAQLQSAMDALWICSSDENSSLDLH